MTKQPRAARQATTCAPDAIPLWVEQTYRGEARGLARALRRRTASAEDALDLVQDAFVRLLALGPKRLAELERGRPVAYLARTATNLVRDRVKQDRRRAAQHHLPADDVVLVGLDLARQLDARDDLRRLEAVMLSLRPRTRAIYMAHRVEGLSYAEIAERYGMSVKGVEKQMSRALAAVDAALHRG